jgi:serine/threonine protein kinase
MTTNTIAAPSATADQALAELVDQLTERLAAGEAIDLDEVVAEHSEHAERLRAIWPALQTLVEIGSSGPTPNSRLPGSRLPIPDSLLPLGTLGDFRLIREIGRGGMGIVYEAEQLSLRRRVALKILPFASLLDPRQLTRFQNEAYAAASLHHEHIVPVYGTGQDRGVHFYAMQYIEGQTLASVINDLSSDRDADEPSKAALDTSTMKRRQSDTAGSKLGKEHFRRVAQIGIQVAQALEYAHQQGIVHRDIKPSNVMLDAKGKAWVLDFGLAAVETQPNLTMTGDLLGTLRYMSPEQASGQTGLVDQRADVYSLGITLFELATLRPLYPESDRVRLLQQISQTEPISPRKLSRQIPADLATIIEKCVQKDKADRYASAVELEADLRRFEDHRPIQARPATNLKRSLKWANRNTSLVAVAAIACLLVACVSVASAAIALKSRNDAQFSLQSARDAQSEAAQRLRESVKLINDLGQILEEHPSLREVSNRKAKKVILDHCVALQEARKTDPALQWELARAQLLAKTSFPLKSDNVKGREGSIKYVNSSDENRKRTAAAIDSAWTTLAPLRQPGTFSHQQAELVAQTMMARAGSLSGMHQSKLTEMTCAETETAFAELLSEVERFTAKEPDNRLWELVDAEIRRQRSILYVNCGQADKAGQDEQHVLTRIHRASEYRSPSQSFTAIQLTVIDFAIRASLKRSDMIGAATLSRQAIQIDTARPEVYQVSASPPIWLVNAERACAILSRLERRPEAEEVARNCASRLPALLDGDAARGSTNRGNHPEWYFRCAQMCEAAGLRDDAQRLRARACDLARHVFIDALERGLATLRPKPWECATWEAKAFESQGAFEDARVAALEAWWSWLAANSFMRYQEHAQIEWKFPISRLHQSSELIAANALFWLHSTPPNTPDDRDPSGLADLRELIDLPMAALFDDLFTSDGVALIQNALAWQLATWPDETRRDVKLARELAQAALKHRPKDEGIINTLGVAEYRCGDYTAAVKTLDESAQLNQGRNQIDHYFLAMAHAKLGQSAKAQEHWKAAQALVSRPGYVMSEDLRRFQAEAEKVLAETSPSQTEAPMPREELPPKL